MILVFFPVVLAMTAYNLLRSSWCMRSSSHEPFGLVAIEAMASGTVVASDVAVFSLL